ncbi:MAG: hypothetical protein ACNI25_09740 [Halarcobacter sp.]
MTEIKEKLKNFVIATMIPEVEAYLDDLHTLLEENKASDDDMDAIREMESFLVELQNIVLAVDEDKIDDQQASEIYGNIMKMVEEHKEH